MKPKKDTDAVLKALARYGRDGDAYLAHQEAQEADSKSSECELRRHAVDLSASYPIRSFVVRRMNSRFRWTVVTGHAVTVYPSTIYHRSDPRHVAIPCVRLSIDARGYRLGGRWVQVEPETLAEWCDRMADAWLVLSPGDARKPK